MTFSLSTVSFASTETESIVIDGEVCPVYASSSYTIEVPKNTSRNYNKSYIDDAIKQAKERKLNAATQPGEMRVVGTLAGKPLYAKKEVSIETRGTTKIKNDSQTYYFDFGWGAGREPICKATVQGTFDIDNRGQASVVKVSGTYSILDDRCSAEWNDSLKITDKRMCQIGFDLTYNRNVQEIVQIAFAEGSDYFVLISPS